MIIGSGGWFFHFPIVGCCHRQRITGSASQSWYYFIPCYLNSPKCLPQVAGLQHFFHCRPGRRAFCIGSCHADFDFFATSASGFTSVPLAKGRLQPTVPPHCPDEFAVLVILPPFGPSSLPATDVLHPLLISAPRSRPLRIAQSPPGDTAQTSRGKTSRLHRAPAEFTSPALDDYGLRDHLPARPAGQASYPILVYRVAALLRASFRPCLATQPLHFANASPPSGCIEGLSLPNC